jgi:hypothetical protein
MKRVTPYLKMRVLGAIEFAPGNTIVDRIKHVSGIVFTEENDQRHQFTGVEEKLCLSGCVATSWS